MGCEMAPKFTVLSTQTLYPCVCEQHFNRSLAGVPIFNGIDTVTLRARNKAHKCGGQEYSFKMER